MAFDSALQSLMRADLAGHPVTEQRMFGGLAFMLGGHMVSGLHKGGAMYRIGQDHQPAARAIPGTGPMMMGDRVMAGMILADAALMSDPARRARLTALALATVAALPPKPPKKRNG
jgi:hypothetical protein